MRSGSKPPGRPSCWRVDETKYEIGSKTAIALDHQTQASLTDAQVVDIFPGQVTLSA
jgi:hypothetical protein